MDRRGWIIALGIIVGLGLVVLVQMLFWPVDDAPIDTDGDASASAPADLGRDHDGHDAGGAHDPHAHDTPAPLAWDLELDERAGAALTEAGLGWRVTCTPQPADFDPGPPRDLMEDSFVLPPTDAPGGSFRHEVTEPTGMRGLHDHGYTKGMITWDVNADPPCVVSPTPSRYVVGRIPGWEPDMQAELCNTVLEVDADGSVDEEVEASHKAHLIDGVLGCRLVVRHGDEVVMRGQVPMRGEGPTGLGELEDVRPVDDQEREEVEQDTLADLQERLALARAGKGPVDELYGRRLDGLRRVMASDPALNEALQPRLERLKAEYDDNARGYQQFMGELIDQAKEQAEGSSP